MITKTIEISDYELERGKPMPSLQHAVIQSNILNLIRNAYKKRFNVLPELSLELNGETFVPDLSIYNYFKVDLSELNIKYKVAPLLTIEILSPTQTVIDLILKMKKLIDNGVKSYWLVEPSTKTIFVYNHKKEQTTFASGLIHDKEINIEINMEDIFE